MRVPLPSKDLVAVTVVLLSVTAGLAIRENYYGWSAEVPRLTLVLVVWLLLMGSSLAALRRGSDAVRAAGRVSLPLALAVWLYLVGAGAVHRIVGDSLAPMAVLGICCLVIAAGTWFALRADNAWWATMRRVACILCLLFVASQPTVAAIRAPLVLWPDRVPSEKAHDGKALTVFLLLDELNAKSAEPNHPVVGGCGQACEVQDVGARRRFNGQGRARNVCGQALRRCQTMWYQHVVQWAHVLDFSKIRASRPDVDVVGFYEPYCAIRGLR